MSDEVSGRSPIAKLVLSANSVSNPVTLACPLLEMAAHKSAKRGNRVEFHPQSLRSAIQLRANKYDDE